MQATDDINLRPMGKKMTMGSEKIYTVCLNCEEVASSLATRGFKRGTRCDLSLEPVQSRSKKHHRVVFFKDDEGREVRVVTSLRYVSAEEITNLFKPR